MSEGSGLNPMNWPDHLRQYRTPDPESDGSARNVQDPEVWDDPDPGFRARITPDTTAQWLVAISVGIPMVGVAAHLFPIFGPAFRNPITIFVGILLSILIATYLKGRQSGMEAYQNLDKSIVYYGDSVDVRAGEEMGEAGRETLFGPYASVSYGGFSFRRLLKRDLPYQAHKLRSNGRQDETGEEPVRDRLNVTTVEADTDNLGKFLVTHAEDLKHDEHGRDSERYTTLPTEMDEDVATDMNELIDRVQHQIKTLKQQKDMLKRSNEEIRDLREAELIPEIEKSVQLMEKMMGIASQQKDEEKSRPAVNGHSKPDPDEVLNMGDDD